MSEIQLEICKINAKQAANKDLLIFQHLK